MKNRQRVNDSKMQRIEDNQCEMEPSGSNLERNQEEVERNAGGIMQMYRNLFVTKKIGDESEKSEDKLKQTHEIEGNACEIEENAENSDKYDETACETDENEEKIEKNRRIVDEISENEDLVGKNQEIVDKIFENLDKIDKNRNEYEQKLSQNEENLQEIDKNEENLLETDKTIDNPQEIEKNEENLQETDKNEENPQPMVKNDENSPVTRENVNPHEQNENKSEKIHQIEESDRKVSLKSDRKVSLKSSMERIDEIEVEIENTDIELKQFGDKLGETKDKIKRYEDVIEQHVKCHLESIASGGRVKWEKDIIFNEVGLPKRDLRSDENPKSDDSAKLNDGPVDRMDIVLEEIGQFGTHQLFHLVLILVPIILSGTFDVNFIVTGATDEYR